MATRIDWHSHRTPPELAGELGRLNGKKPHLYSFDFPDFLERLKSFTERNSGKLLHL